MKKIFDETIELITPCFCAGADQAHAEIRAASIRGELRWWFRSLGGSKEEEQAVFGGIAGEQGTASRVVVRVSDVRLGPMVKLAEKPNDRPDDPFYLLYFAHASGEGIRYEEGGCLTPGTRFRLQVLERRSGDNKKLRVALDSFLRLGSVGYRSNRACGALSTPSRLESFESFYDWVKQLPSGVQVGWQQNKGQPKFSSSWKSAFSAESNILKTFRKSGYSAEKYGNDPSPFGRSDPRQGSGVRLRPVLLKEGFLVSVVYVPCVVEEVGADTSFHLTDVKIGNEVLGT